MNHNARDDDFDLDDVDLADAEEEYRPRWSTVDPSRFGTKPPKRRKSPWYWRVKPRKKYDPGRPRNWPKFESVATCKRKRGRRISDLKGLGTASAYALARLLESCRKYRRCGSLACPICMRQLRRVEVSQALHALRHAKRPLFFVTLIQYDYVMKYGLEALEVRRFKRNVMKRIQNALPAECRLRGRVEIGFEPDLGGFLAHVHFISAGATYEELRQLKPKYNVPQGKRPLVVKRIRKRGDEMRVMTYTFKQFPRNMWSKRQMKGAVKRQSSSTPRTRGTPIELQRLLGLAQLRPEDLVVSHGLRRDRNGRRLRRIS